MRYMLYMHTNMHAYTLKYPAYPQISDEWMIGSTSKEAGLVSAFFPLNMLKTITGTSKFLFRLKVCKQLQDHHQEVVEIRAGRGG